MKIDLVYCWVDKEDPEYIKRHKGLIIKRDKLINNGGDNQIDELKYSLRSIEKYMPWINNIFIVTDKQTPKWINTSNKRIHIIDQATILPHDRPCFNTSALEASFYKIKGLSEYFILGSDDYFVNKPLPKSYFFNSKGMPYYSILKEIWWSKDPKYYTELFIPNAFVDKKIPNRKFMMQHTHNFVAQRKSHWKYMVEESNFKEPFAATRNNTYRNFYDVSRHLVNYHFAMTGGAILRRVSWAKEMSTEWSSIFCIDLFRPVLFCINDSKSAKDKQRKKVVRFLNKKYPNKSSFEK